MKFFILNTVSMLFSVLAAASSVVVSIEATTTITTTTFSSKPRKEKQYAGNLRRTITETTTTTETETTTTTLTNINPSNEFDTRIVGGNDVTEGDYPYFVNWDGCGASLIYEDIILTAAHCNPICTPNLYIGAYDKYDVIDNINVDQRTIVQRRVHPNYNALTIENDFMILKINRPSTKIPVTLPELDTIEPLDDGNRLTVIGFGGTFEGDFDGSQILQEVQVDTVDHDKCNLQYRNAIIEDVMFCAGETINGGKDSCQGDSGGPIINSDGNQVGVVSFGQGCGNADFPGVYARVSSVTEWINEQICELSKNPPSSCPSNNNDNGNGNGNGNDNGNVDYDGTGNKIPIVITITFDEYPDENGFRLIRKNNDKNNDTDTDYFNFNDNNNNVDIIANYPVGSFPRCTGIYEETFYLPSGQYNLEIIDLFADGICCTYGQGNADIRNGNTDEVLIETNGKFSSHATLSFEISIPIPPEADQFNNNINNNNNDNNNNNNNNSNNNNNNNNNVSNNVPPDESINNNTNNNNNNNNTVSNNEIPPTTDTSTTDSMISNNNNNNSNNQDCNDAGIDRIFHVDSDIGDKDCIWLNMNLERFDYLCKFVDVADACRTTCNTCHYFVQQQQQQ